VAAVWDRIDRDWAALAAEEEVRLQSVVGDAVAALARVYLLAVPGLADVGALVDADRPLATGLAPPDGDSPAVLGEAVGRIAARARVGDVGPVVRATGRRPDEALAALDAVDGAAGLDALRGALATAGHGDRWRGWLVRSLVDDLAAWRRSAAAAALAGATPATEAAAAVAGWASTNAAALAGVRAMAAAAGTAPDPVTAVAVAVRRLPPPAATGGPDTH
jgi:hypothetical protein